MAKVLPGLFALLAAGSAYAQAEAPMEKASPLTVVIFVVLFFAGCAGYFAYLWWNQRKIKQRGAGKQPDG